MNGLIRQVDSMGRVLLPVEIRRHFNIIEGDKICIAIREDAIVIKTQSKSCVFCNNRENLVMIKTRYVCNSCKQEVI
ncbi:AbrB/MazE/SpoVT family DNA-binding domain-containing protein [Brevibacillus centrosporus]|uniref:AbrB/MazE/SpoVT family DNA-binding domain-containing protein n=1 Tax=Brevibacillus centrosporus TaxID=54910 RepID=UPI000B84FB8D